MNRKFHPNYLHLILGLTFTLPVLTRSIEKGFDLNSVIIILLIISIVVGVIIILARQLKTVTFESNYLLLTYLITGFKIKIRYDNVQGIIYNFYHDKRTKIRSKEVELLTSNGRSIYFKQTFFANFNELEKTLTSKFILLKKSSKTELTDIEMIDFQRENRFFDLARHNWNFRTSLIAVFVFLLLGSLILKSRQFDFTYRDVLDGLYFIGLGIFFLYVAVRNSLASKKNKVANN